MVKIRLVKIGTGQETEIALPDFNDAKFVKDEIVKVLQNQGIIPAFGIGNDNPGTFTLIPYKVLAECLIKVESA